MSFFKKIWDKTGIGGMKVNLILDSAKWTAGGEVTGRLRIQGGMTAWEAKHCEISLYTEYSTYRTDAEGNQRASSARIMLQSYTVECGPVIEPSEVVEIPIRLLLPLYTPITAQREAVWFETRIHLDKAVDPNDKDRLSVGPDPLLQLVLAAMERLGFYLVKSYLTENNSDEISPDCFIQRMIYSVSDEYRLLLNEIVMTPAWRDEALRLTFEVNKKAGVLRTLTGKDIVQMMADLHLDEWRGKSEQEMASWLKAVIERALTVD